MAGVTYLAPSVSWSVFGDRVPRPCACHFYSPFVHPCVLLRKGQRLKSLPHLPGPWKSGQVIWTFIRALGRYQGLPRKGVAEYSQLKGHSASSDELARRVWRHQCRDWCQGPNEKRSGLSLASGPIWWHCTSFQRPILCPVKWVMTQEFWVHNLFSLLETELAAKFEEVT